MEKGHLIRELAQERGIAKFTLTKWEGGDNSEVQETNQGSQGRDSGGGEISL
jgi:hypothetical protein